MTFIESVGLDTPLPLGQEQQNSNFAAGNLEPFLQAIARQRSNSSGSFESGLEVSTLTTEETEVLPFFPSVSPASFTPYAPFSPIPDDLSGETADVALTPPPSNKALVFLDSAINDVADLVAGVAPGAEVFVLNSQLDGVAQISQVLATRTDISSIHIVSFGQPGSLQLGGTHLNLENLSAYAETVSGWASALTANADILLYGCDVAANASGLALVQQLSQLTGADVAASNDLTGSAALGGDWDLEVTTGTVESPLGFDAQTLQDYDSVFDTLSINSVTVTEGDLGATTQATFTINLARTSANPVSVVFQTSNDTAIAPGDYQAVTRTVAFGANETSRIVTVPIIGDNNVEIDETFDVTLTNASQGTTIGVAQGSGTILDDDELSLFISNATVTEGDTGTTNAVFTLNLTEAVNQPVTVSYTTANSTATQGQDYQQTAGVVTFAPGEIVRSITVPVIGDVLVEDNEAFFVQLSNPSANVVLGNDQAVGTIIEDDQLFLSVSNTSVIEGDDGTQNAVFTVSLTPGEDPVTVNYAAVGDTATAGTDFTAVNGTLSFAPGEAARTVTVPITSDTLTEINETFFLELSNPTGAAIADNPGGVGTILDDDLSISGTKWEDLNNDGVRDPAEPPFPGVTIYLDLNDNGMMDEGDRTTVTDENGRYQFNDLLSGDYVVREVVPEGYVQTFPEGEVTVTGPQPPTPPLPNATVELATAPGDGSVSLRIDPFGSIVDTAPYDPIGAEEPAETVFASDVAFRVGTSGPRQFLSEAVGDDPNAGFVEISDNSAKSNFTLDGLNFTLTQTVRELNGANGRTGSILVQTYVISNPGNTPASFELVRYFDGDLRFDGSLVDGGGRLIAGGREILFETDTAGEPTTASTFIGITGEGGTIPTSNRFEIDAFSGLTNRIEAGEALDGQITGDSADADQFVDQGQGYDITLALRNTFNLAPGRSTTYTTTTIFGTGIPEDLDLGQEGLYRLTLEPGQNIEDADFGNFLIPVPDIAIEGVTAPEGTGGTTNFNFTVSLSEPTIVPVTVTYETVAQSAIAGSDFTPSTGTITFSPGQTEQTISVPVTADNAIEPTETFSVRLTGATRGIIDPTQNQAVGTILDDDQPAVTINDVAITEGNGGTQNATFTVSLDRPGIFPVTLNYTTQDGTATAGSDYQSVSGSLNFAVGETQQTISVPVIGDTALEPDENFFVLLTGITNAVAADAQAIGTIINDESSPSVPAPPSPSPAPTPTPTPPPTPFPTPPPNPTPPLPPPTPPPILSSNTIFDFADYTQFFGNAGTGPVNPTDLARLIFDESYYLASNPAVAQEVARGNYASGFVHFLQFGQFEGRDPSPLFNTSFYLAENPGVAQAVASGQIPSAFQHFINAGIFEGRDPSQLFDNSTYLAQNPQVAQAVAAGAFASGLQHYLLFGQFEGREPRIQLFDEAFYLAQNPGVAAAVAADAFSSGLEHYTKFGQFEGRDPSPYFSESFYLSQYPAIAQAVAQGVFRSGFEHYLLFGRGEGRSPRPA